MRTRSNLEPYSYRRDVSVPTFPDDRPIFVFDGKCVLCSNAAQFVLKHDRRRRFRLVPAQSALGRALYNHYGLDARNYTTNILIVDGMAWLKSESSLRIFQLIGLPWSLAATARVLPRSVRDWLYDIIARNRIKWFGARDNCLVSVPGHEDRFLA